MIDLVCFRVPPEPIFSSWIRQGLSGPATEWMRILGLKVWEICMKILSMRFGPLKMRTEQGSWFETASGTAG